MTADRKRRAVRRLGERYPQASLRRRCRIVHLSRSGWAYRSRKASKDAALTAELMRLAGKHPRFGYRRMADLLRAKSWQVNDKRVARLWREAGLKVPRRQVKRRRLGHSANGIQRRRPEGINHVWSYDFISDQTEDGRRLKLLVVFDEYTRRALAIRVARSCRGADVVDTLAGLFRLYGPPAHIRSDNGPEFIADDVRRFLRKVGVQTLFIQPGAPWENGYVESFNARFRDDCLDRELFASLREAKVVIESWRRDYNHIHPHGSLGRIPPAEFTRRVEATRMSA